MRRAYVIRMNAREHAALVSMLIRAPAATGEAEAIRRIIETTRRETPATLEQSAATVARIRGAIDRVEDESRNLNRPPGVCKGLAEAAEIMRGCLAGSKAQRVSRG